MDIHSKPAVSIPDGPPPGELQIEDLVDGDGAEASAGMQVTVDYVGVSWSTQREFDASWNRNDTFSFGLGGQAYRLGSGYRACGSAAGGD